MAAEVLVKVEGLSKKFCKDLKTSLWYGVKDLVSGITGSQANRELRDKEFWAVKDISFELRRGECLGLIGHNGAGKSTLLKILNGLINPDEGSVTMRGRVGALIELGAGFNPILTGRENIYNNGAVLGFTRKEIDAKVEEIIDFSEIREFIDMPVQNYSSGMKVRLGFAVAVQMEPDVLIIDEVLAVGDLGFYYKCINAIGELLKNAAVIFVSHSMPQVFRICNAVILLKAGKTLMNTYAVGEAVENYLSSFSSGDEQTAGTGEAKLISLKLESIRNTINEDQVLNLNHGDDLTILFVLKVDNSIKEYFVEIVVWNQQMIPVLCVIAKDNLGFCIDNSKTHKQSLKLTLSNIELNAGLHNISILVSNKSGDRLYLRHDKAGTFKMPIEYSAGADLVLKSDIEILE
jgi:lipopolysaccharide transport system ATP-binding protein